MNRFFGKVDPIFETGSMMKLYIQCFVSMLVMVFVSGCAAGNSGSFESKEVYRSATLVITRISPHAYQHTTYLQTNDFGKVPCNGLLVVDGKEAVVFDTPTDDAGAEELIQWTKGTLHGRITAIVPTHFHDDCLGGLKAFHKNAIPSYGFVRTIELATRAGYEVPRNSFRDSVILKVGREKVTAKFFGEGHTQDNVVGYFPKEHVMFGGCLVKELGASKGYLGDANLSEWSNTVQKVKAAYPGVKLVVPGHGKCGDVKLLDYTIGMFRAQ